MTGRDFLGYGVELPRIEWPDAAPVVSFVVNFEEGAEFAVSEGDSRNEAIYEVEHRLEGLPDLCLDSHFEYGARAGWRRVMNVLDAHAAKPRSAPAVSPFSARPSWRATPSRAVMKSRRTAGAGKATPA